MAERAAAVAESAGSGQRSLQSLRYLGKPATWALHTVMGKQHLSGLPRLFSEPVDKVRLTAWGSENP